MTEIKDIHTPCKNCTMAIYDGKTQIDCALDRIKKYGPEVVVEAEDEDKEFFVINGRFCKAYTTANETIAEVYERIKLKFGAIVILNNTNTVADTVLSLMKSAEPISEIVFVFWSDIDIAAYNKQIFDMVGNKISWRLLKIVDYDNSWTSAVSGFKNKNLDYYVVLEEGTELHNLFLTEVDDVVNEQLKQLLVIFPDEESYNGLTIYADVNKVLGKVSFDEIISKVQEALKADEINVENSNYVMFVDDEGLLI